jgi:hypothetical protein
MEAATGRSFMEPRVVTDHLVAEGIHPADDVIVANGRVKPAGRVALVASLP